MMTSVTKFLIIFYLHTICASLKFLKIPKVVRVGGAPRGAIDKVYEPPLIDRKKQLTRGGRSVIILGH